MLIIGRHILDKIQPLVLAIFISVLQGIFLVYCSFSGFGNYQCHHVLFSPSVLLIFPPLRKFIISHLSIIMKRIRVYSSILWSNKTIFIYNKHEKKVCQVTYKTLASETLYLGYIN